MVVPLSYYILKNMFIFCIGGTLSLFTLLTLTFKEVYIMKKNLVIEKAKKESAERTKNLGKEQLSRQQRVSRTWGLALEKDTK